MAAGKINEVNMGKNNWLKITIEADPCLVEAISDFVVGVLEAGVETGAADEPHRGTIVCYLPKANPSREEVAENVARVRAMVEHVAGLFATEVPKVIAELYDEEDWGATWKSHFTSFAIVPGLIIAPTWEGYRAKQGEKVITMDPGMAFGTGHHATTTLCLELLQETLQAEPGQAVLDVGTGTGILGMAALHFGAARVMAIDNDPEAVAAASANAAANGFSQAMTVALTPLADLGAIYDLVVANIVHDVLLQLGEDLIAKTRIGGSLILSGLLRGVQVSSIEGFFRERGFLSLESRERGEWAALAMRRSK